MQHRLKRLWLRYVYYFKQHWIIAASLSITLLWFLLNVVIQLLPLMLEGILTAL